MCEYFPAHPRNHTSHPNVAHVVTAIAGGALHVWGPHPRNIPAGSQDTASQRLQDMHLVWSSQFSKLKWFIDIRKWHKSDRGAISADISGPSSCFSKCSGCPYLPLHSLSLSRQPHKRNSLHFRFNQGLISHAPCWTLGKLYAGSVYYSPR